MIKDIQELIFPSYATMSAATVAQPDMGEWNITSQMKIDGQITPDFTYNWEVVYKGHKYIMPLRKPQGSKENTSLNATVDLTFKHWAMYQLQRYFFFETASVGAGTVIPDKYVASVNLNLENFCILFSRVLEFYFGDKITLDIDQATIQNATSDVQQVEISYAYIWDVLLKFYEVYGVRWQIEPNGSPDKYVIKIRYGSGVELSHIFEYGFKGGLLKVERQVQNPDIRNIILGRGGEKNLPYRYFKDADPNNPSFKADPDWIPELAQIPFTQLHGATFRSYIRGWKAKHYGGTTKAADCYAPWAWQKGYTDTTFAPVEFVYDEQSIAFYGELWGALDDNEDIYPSIQNRVREGVGRIDEVVAVEPIISDDYAAKSEKESQPVNVNLCSPNSVFVKKNTTETITLVGGSFTIPQGLTGAFDYGYAVAEAWDNPRFNGASSASARGGNGRVPEYDKSLSATVKAVYFNGKPSDQVLTAGTYTWSAEVEVENTSNKDLTATVALPNPTVEASNADEEFTNTWCVWIKDVFNTPKPANKTAEAFAAEVWDPLLGDRLGNEAALFFTSGMLSTSEDYTFLLAKRPEYDTSKSIEVAGVGTVQSMWKLTLQKSDADFDATGKWLPSTMRQASAGDHFAFEGIELPHSYVLMAEEEIDNAKLDYLSKFKDIKPTWVVSLDRVRISTAQADEVTALIDQITPGAAVRLHDPRFILNAQGAPAAYETLYISNVNITYREPTSDDAALNPDVEITLSDKYEMAASTVQRMQSEIDALTRQVGSIGNIEQIVRAVGDKLYLRKDGLADISMSPTQFFSLLTSGDFRNGMVGGAGWGFFRDANGNWVLETDRINVRQEMQVNSLVINQVKGQGGTIVEGAAVIEEVTEVIEDNSGIYCYFDTKNGTVFNQFRVDDVAYCHRYVPTTAADNAGNVAFGTVKFYKRRVIAVGDNYIKLSKTDVNGSGIPAEGDAIIHYGNYTDKQRQFVKVRDVIGGGYERYIEDLNSVNTAGTEYYFVGRQAGMYNNRPRFYLGDPNGYIEWVNGELNIKGKLNTLSTIGNTNIGDYVNNAAQTAADAAKAELQGKIDALQNQVDGVVEAWSYPYTPTASNYPANQWTTDGEKNAHVGDVFYNIQPAYNADGSANPDAGKAWRWSQGDTEHGGTYHWHPIADSDAVRALQLAQMSVLDTDVLYKQHTSPTDPPALPVVNTSGTITNPNGWSTAAPAYEVNKYIWQTTYVKKGDGQASFSTPTCISGRDGNGIDHIEEEYYLSTSRTALQGGSWSTTRQTWVAGRFYWTRSHVYYTDGTDETYGEVCVTGESGAAGTSVLAQYSADSTTWHPAYQSGDVWMRTSSDGGTTWTAAVRIVGAQGYSVVASVSRPNFTEALWNTYGTTGHVENWSYTENIRNGCRVGDYFRIYGTATDTGNGHVLVYRSDTASGTLHGECVSHEIAEAGTDGKWRKFQWALGTETAVTGTWQDAPMSAPAGQYVWMHSGIVVPPATEPTTWETATRLTGDKGQSGDSVYMLDLSDEMMPMPCDAAGNVVGTYSTSQASVYKGGTKVTSGITYSIAQQTGVSATITSAGVVTPSALTADRGTIVVQAVVAGVTLQTTLSLYKVKPGANYSNNLLLNTDRVATSSGYKVTEYALASKPVVGETYTITIWGQLAATRTSWGIWNSGAVINLVWGIKKIADGVYSTSFVWKNTQGSVVANDTSIWVYQIDSAQSGTSTINKIKLEKGNNPDPVWTPAASEMLGQDGQDAVVYQLELSANNISRNALGQLSATSITVQKYKTTGASARVLTTEKKIRYQRLGVDTGYTEVQTGVNSTSISVPNDPALTAIVVELLDTNNAVLDRERVPLIQDGAELTENLVLNAEEEKVSNASTFAVYKTSETIVDDGLCYYTFSLWLDKSVASGCVAYVNAGNNLPGFNPGGICSDPIALTAVADGVYSGYARINYTSNVPIANYVTFQVLSSVSHTIRYAKVEKGINLAPIWTQSPHDMDYLKKAMQENGSMEGGLILASLMQMGFTNSSGTYKKMSGVSGIAENADDLAFWAGGEMIDPDKQPTASNLPTFGVRHDGSAFAAGNTIRFLQNLIEVGKYLKLDQNGLKMQLGGIDRLIVGNKSVDSSSVNYVPQRKDFTSVVSATYSYNNVYYYLNGTTLSLYISGLLGDKTQATGLRVAKGRTLSFDGSIGIDHSAIYGGELTVNTTAVPKLTIQLKDGSTVRKTFNVTASPKTVNNIIVYDLSKLYYDVDAAITSLSVTVLFTNGLSSLPSSWSHPTSGEILVVPYPDSAVYVKSTQETFRETDVAVLGTNGTQFSWGDSHQCQKDGLWGVRVGNCGLQIRPNSIMIMTDGLNWYTIGNYIRKTASGEITGN